MTHVVQTDAPHRFIHNGLRNNLRVLGLMVVYPNSRRLGDLMIVPVESFAQHDRVCMATEEFPWDHIRGAKSSGDIHWFLTLSQSFPQMNAVSNSRNAIIMMSDFQS